MTVQAYTKGMMRNLWGDNLMIACLARTFGRDISIISRTYVRSFLAAGGEAQGVTKGSLWIAHRGEEHYYAVVRAENNMGGMVPVSDILASGEEQQLARSLKRKLEGGQTVSDVSSFPLVSVPPDRIAPDTRSVPVKDVKRRLRGKQNGSKYLDATYRQPLSVVKSTKKGLTCKADPSPRTSPHDSKADSSQSGRLCGNCGRKGHQAVTCVEPCFACGGAHRYYACDDPQLYHVAKRQAARNRVKWTGYGAEIAIRLIDFKTKFRNHNKMSSHLK